MNKGVCRDHSDLGWLTGKEKERQAACGLVRSWQGIEDSAKAARAPREEMLGFTPYFCRFSAIRKALDTSLQAKAETSSYHLKNLKLHRGCLMLKR